MQKLKLAIPISHLFEEKNPNTEKILELSDTLEIKSLPEPAWLPKKKKRIFHSNLGLVEAAFKKTFDETLPYLLENKIALFSCDLGPAAEGYFKMLPITPVLSRREIQKKMAESLSHLRKNFKGSLAVENYNYFPTGLYSHICEPEFISSTLDKFDLGLVLDLAHALISAHNLHMDIYDYLKALPLERVKEIHLSRPLIPDDPNDLASDAHDPPGQREYQLLNLLIEKLLPKTGWPPIYFVVEYYKSLDHLYEIMSWAKDCRKKARLKLLEQKN
ncbi:MAG: DUF692 family protein [Deltaproteobacteria bacterium]|jgi:uncharacterized protein (UPF0276 family)|nr:DUF692 family protein [Deltaproteobacteria bacterium]